MDLFRRNRQWNDKRLRNLNDLIITQIQQFYFFLVTKYYTDNEKNIKKKLILGMILTQSTSYSN